MPSAQHEVPRLRLCCVLSPGGWSVALRRVATGLPPGVVLIARAERPEFSPPAGSGGRLTTRLP